MSSLGVRSIKSCSAGRVRFPYEPSQPGSDYHFGILPSRIADAPGVLPKANSNWGGFDDYLEGPRQSQPWYI